MGIFVPFELRIHRKYVHPVFGTSMVASISELKLSAVVNCITKHENCITIMQDHAQTREPRMILIKDEIYTN